MLRASTAFLIARAHGRVDASGPAPELAAPPTEEEIDIGHELAQYLAFFIARLPSPYREAITLVELERVSQVDAARMLGLSVSGMKSRVQRGRAKLRAILEACCEFALDARSRIVGCRPRADGSVPEGCCPLPRDGDRGTSGCG